MHSDPSNTTSPQALQAQEPSLGVAGAMAKAFIHSPLSPLFLFACLGMGLLGLIFTPRQEDPQISVPMVDIFVSYPGASSQQVSTLVSNPLERIMSEISGIKHVYSASMRGQAMITAEFDVGQDMEKSLVKLHDKLQSNMDKIPPGVTPPLVKPKAVDDVPILSLTLWSTDIDDGALRTLALDVLQRINEVSNSSQGFIVGGRSEQIRIEVYPERLSGYGISLDQIAQTVRTANSELGVGNVESSDQGFKVYTGAFLKSAQDIAHLVVGTYNNTPVYVRDVARVFAGPEETKQMVIYHTGPSWNGPSPIANGAPAVTIAIAKKKGSNGVSVANDVLAKVEELKGQLIPKNVNIAVTRNYGETANEKVNELLFKLMVATMAVTILVWLSLGIRPAIVTLIVIPVVILMTVFSAWILGYTIDRVSLFALIFSIGILVDDAIVVVENIYRRWLLEDNCCHLISVDAVREVGNPTIIATLTVIAALLPMGFVSGMMGPYMRPIPALGSVAMLFSLFAAFIFTPWLTQHIKPPMRTLHIFSEKEHRQVELLERFYRWIIPPLIHNPKKGYGFLFGLIGAFALSMALFYTTDVTVKILPLDNKPEFNVVINLPEGTALPKTVNLARQMAETIRKEIPEVTALQTYIGTASPFNFNGMVRHYYLRSDSWQADIQVQLVHKKQRKRTSHDLAILTRDLLTPMAKAIGGKIQVVEMPPGPPVLQSVVAEVTGPDERTRRLVAEDMTKMFEKSEIIVDEDNYMQAPMEIWRFEVDTEKAVRRGVSVDAINRNLGMAMGGSTLGDVKKGTILEPTYIVLQVPLEIRAKISSLADLPIATPSGTSIPLGELGRFVKDFQDSIIYHKDLRPVEYVTGEVVGRLDAPIYGMSEIEKMLKDYKTPDGVKLSGEYLGPPASYSQSAFEWTGEWTVTFETFRDMGMAFGVALILIYILVVWEFGNFTLPAIIMAPIPLTLIGIVPGHWLMDAKFTATSMIGFIALAGIIVRNSILLVDFTQMELFKGTSLEDAVILSCKARTRPILITAFALVAGSSVIVTDFIFQGMAISLLFGVLVSTILTLLVIPLGCITARNAFIYPNTSGPSSIAEAMVDTNSPFRTTPGLLLRISGLFGRKKTEKSQMVKATQRVRQERLENSPTYMDSYVPPPTKGTSEKRSSSVEKATTPPTDLSAVTASKAAQETESTVQKPSMAIPPVTSKASPLPTDKSLDDQAENSLVSATKSTKRQTTPSIPLEEVAATKEVTPPAPLPEEPSESTTASRGTASRRGIRLKKITPGSGEG
ncbi:MAG: efflux RND transporter permease subunit [Magnetococcus sp. DMHC-6]